ncbi:ankyrin repeat domain-containing protein [Candidatus Babeliales bacterium]|nr:ankyrin repeat domain-containing protein [Candidatus Babeliales bacterium]
MIIRSLFITLLTCNQLFSTSHPFPKKQKSFELINKSDTKPLYLFLKKDTKNIDTYRKIHDGNSLLHEAVSINSLKMVGILISNGIDPNMTNDDSNTPLHMAVTRGYTEIVQYLLEHGANPNIGNLYNDTPLHLAILSDQPEKIKVSIILELLKHGTDLEHKNIYKTTPLQQAIEAENCQYIIDILSNYKQKSKCN